MNKELKWKLDARLDPSRPERDGVLGKTSSTNKHEAHYVGSLHTMDCVSNRRVRASVSVGLSKEGPGVKCFDTKNHNEEHRRHKNHTS